MINPVKRNAMFTTPNDIEELWAYINQFSGQEKVVAITAAAMATNLAAKMVDIELGKSRIESSMLH